jgi:TonB family protein
MAAKPTRLLLLAALLTALTITFTLGLNSPARAATGDEGKVVDTSKALNEKLPSPDEFIAVDVSPVLLNAPEPAYPDSAKNAGIEGSVWVKALVDKQGSVRIARVDKASGKKVGFEESALAAAKLTTWKPAVLKGQPIAVWVTYEVKYTLAKK